MTARRRTRADPRAGAVVVVLAATAVACAPPSPPAPEQAPAAVLRIGLTEWTVETSAAVVLPGEVEVVVTNAGATGHDVLVHGEVGTWGTRVLGPGEQQTFTVTAVADEVLALECTVAGHHSAGMHAQVDVAPEPAPAATSPGAPASSVGDTSPGAGDQGTP